MLANTNQVVIGVFAGAEEARQAVAELRSLGFPESSIGVIARQADDDADEGAISAMEEGATAGVIGGATVGALWTLGAAAGILPGVGPALIAGGLLASLLTSAAGAAAIGTVVGALLGLGLSEEEAHWYEGEAKAGRTLVVIRAGERYNEAFAGLRRSGAYDIESGPSADVIADEETPVVDIGDAGKLTATR